MSIARLPLAPRRALLLGTTGLCLLFATPALAQCATDGTDFSCSGENTGSIDIFSPAPVEVVIQPGFSITGSNGDAALVIRGGNSITYTDNGSSTVTGTTARGLLIVGGSGGSGKVTVNSAGNITGATLGAQVNSLGSGGVEARFSGSITGIGSFGVGVLNAPGSNLPGIPNNTVLVTSGPVSGTNGIVVEGRGASGSISITTTGTVTGTSATGNAISAQHSVAGVGGDINVTTSNIVSAGVGVNVSNNGTGATTIQINGTVDTAGSGVGAIHTATATALSITTNGAINAGRTGILASNNGSGDTSVTANAQITTQNLNPAVANGIPSGNGITLSNGLLAGNATVRAAGVDGGRGGILVVNNGLGFTSVIATGPVRARAGIGIEVVTSATTTDTIVNSAGVTATGDGINVTHNGTGALSIIATGDVVSENGVGIRARVDAGTDLAVNATNVRGNTLGIFASSRGRDISVTATGLVQANATDGVGVSARNVVGARGIAVNVNAVDAATGIFVENVGTGPTSVTATGLVLARNGSGMDIRTRAASGGTTINVANVTGSTDGITASLGGTGDVVINATGLLSGEAINGLSLSDFAAGNLTINVNQVSGGANGVRANNSGGSFRFTATGLLSGGTGTGASIANNASGVDLLVNVASVQGGVNGLSVFNGGTGNTEVTATGALIGGTGDGLIVTGNTGSGDLTVNLVDASGGRFGLVGQTAGTGNARVTATGTVRGVTAGARLIAVGDAGTMLGDFRNVTGVEAGISARTLGSGRLALITRGLIEGGTAAIDIEAGNGEAWTLTNSGTIRNSSGVSSALAIRSTDGSGTITNSGVVLGTVSLGDFTAQGGGQGPQNVGRIGTQAVPNGHEFVNSGEWNSIGGTSEFLGAADVLRNLSGGRLVGGLNSGVAETTIYSGLETLANNGTITLRDGGIGDVIRTSGDASFGAGSVFAVDAGGAGSDRFLAGGTVTIAPGAQLQVGNPQTLVLGTRYTILEAAGGVTGSFTFTNQLISTFVGYRQGQTANTVFVELAQLRTFAAAGNTFNQRSVAGALDSLPSSNPLAAAVLILPSDTAAQGAFDALSGEIHPGVRTALIEDTRLPRNAALARLDDRRGGAIWGHALGNWGQSDGAAGVGDLRRDGYGAILGADVALGDTASIGIAGAYLERDLDLPSRASSGTLKSTHVLGYAGVRFGGFGIKAGAGYATASIDTVRGIAFPGIAQTVTADYDGTVLQGFAEAGYRIPLAGGHVEPFAQIATIRAETDGFAETGGSAALTASEEQDNATISTLGVRFETARAGAFSVGGMAGWQHGFGTLDPATGFRFATGNGFTVLGAARSRDAAVATIDARFRLSPGITFSVAYDGALGSSGADHSVSGGLRIAF
ncbi:autotransporter domain-containing protein [Sphingomonas sp. G-3-2-10]|uniref:autotransporter domain-containing protein n=1 Tax=Sphingomonas sp. G-3-2-10 TaxID=2728838 RepID=UPI00146F50C9|nr:autotransporter domain-containing protein [Sphingomonas sp. G-3-2-10]NML04337.1 autotransporter domain-containing protein [Sphingomonas sp. G-3-2-10]